MNFEVIKSEDIAIIKAGKSLTIFDVEDLSNPIPDIPTDVKGIVFDLSETSEIDSFGISIVVRIMSYAKNNNKKFSVVVSNNKVSFVIKIDKLDTIIPLHDSLDSAITYLKGQSKN